MINTALISRFFMVFFLLIMALSCTDEDEITASSDTFIVTYKGENDSCGNPKLLFSQEDKQRLTAINISGDSLLYIGENLLGHYDPDQVVEVRVRRLLDGDAPGCESLELNILPYVYVLEDHSVN